MQQQTQREAATAATAGCCPAPGDAQFACTRSNDEIAEIGALLSSLADHSLAPPQRTPNGYSLRLAATNEAAATLGEFVLRDKECCAFLDFEVEERPGEIRLYVVGPPGATETLDLCFAVAQPATDAGTGRGA
jgi:hypothetical protein